MTSLQPSKSCRPNPKYISYSPNGFGRDSYIKYNNGGFLDKISTVKSTEKYDFNSTVRYFNTKRNVSSLKYRSDGTGRDNYVLHESGGLEKEYRSLKTYQLRNFLRTPDSNRFNFKYDPLKEGVNTKTLYISKNQFFQENKLKSLEKDLANRLYYSEQYKFINKEKSLNPK